MDEEEPIPCTFSAFSLARRKDGSLEQKLERPHFDESTSKFRSMRMRLAWLANTRPDCQLEISQLAQVTKTATWTSSP